MSEINNEPIPNAAGPETTAEKAESEQKYVSRWIISFIYLLLLLTLL